MSERPSTEQLADLRKRFAWNPGAPISVIFGELDAVRAERDLMESDIESLRHEIELFRVSVATLTRERDEAQKEAANWKEKFFRSRSFLED